MRALHHWIVFTTLVCALSVPLSVSAQPIIVYLTVINDELEYCTNASCMTIGNGHVTAALNQAPVLMWHMTDPDWSLVKLEFEVDGGGSWVTPPDAALSPCTQASFPDAPQLVGGLIQIWDRNKSECSTHYRVCAAPKSDPSAEICKHPVISNEGTNQNLQGPHELADYIIDILVAEFAPNPPETPLRSLQDKLNYAIQILEEQFGQPQAAVEE